MILGRCLFLRGALAQDATERVHILFPRRPACGKADDAVRLVILIVDAVAYFSYCYFLCKKEENMQKLWFVGEGKQGK